MAANAGIGPSTQSRYKRLLREAGLWPTSDPESD